MQVEIPDTPLATIRAVRHILARHHIEIGLLNIHPETLCEMLNDANHFCFIDRCWDVFKKSGIEGTVYNIPFKQKMI